ncbi:hypothetical protein DFH06DRAFT_1232420 [Mycena polygramma]|nr:hypothetical protein DFH06DRAFT_1232420 [Mycena polygramma]
MSSVPDLRARIAELSWAIQLQKQVLRDLESSKSKAQRDLNAILDPMSRLPLEISSEIFQLCVPHSPGPDSSDAPMLFLRICHSWSNIALSTPSLWNIIHSDGPDAAQLETWLSRARPLPVSFVLRGDLSYHVTDVIRNHAPRVLNLDLAADSSNLEVLGEIIFSSPFPALKRLRIASTDNSVGIHVENALRNAPALLECEFISMYDNAERAGSGDTLTHLCLQHLRLGHPESDPYEPWAHSGSSALLLKHITLPALETLYIGNYDIHLFTNEFSSFLARSSPPLRSLRLVYSDNIMMDGAIGSIPSLADLTLHCEMRDVQPKDILERIAANHDLLPNLRNFSILGWIPNQDDDTILINMITARCAKLHSFRLIFPYNDIYASEDLLITLRQCAENGMQVYVGAVGHNQL